MKTKIQTLKEQINNLTDPRRTSHGNIRHKLEDIIIIGLCTIIRSGEDYADMEAFGADTEYCIALKGNQPTLCKDVEEYFCAYTGETFTYKHLEKGHGRVEIREYYLSHDIGWMEQKEEWAGLQAIGMVKTKVREGEKESEFTRYFITSLTDINEFAYAVHKHWSIENQLHRCLDVIFREDAARARKDNSPLNMNVLRKTALSLLNQAKRGRLSKKKMMFKASLNPDVLLSVLLAGEK